MFKLVKKFSGIYKSTVILFVLIIFSNLFTSSTIATDKSHLAVGGPSDRFSFLMSIPNVVSQQYFAAHPGNIPAHGNRDFKNTFSAHGLSYVYQYFELEVADDTTRTYPFEWIVYGPSGKEFARGEIDQTMLNRGSFDIGAGYQEPGSWQAGRYTTVLKFYGQELSSASFTVVDTQDSSPAPAPTPVPTASQVKVYVDNLLLSFDQEPVIENGRTLVPLRVIFESLGAKVDWDGNTRTVTGQKSSTTVSLQIGNTAATVNNRQVNLDVPAKILNGRTLVPARFIAESLGAQVDWDGATRTVYIKSPASDGTGIALTNEQLMPTVHTHRETISRNQENFVDLSAQGIQVYIPQGALQQDTNITIKPKNVSSLNDSNNQVVKVLKGYEVTIDNQSSFPEDLLLIINYDESDLLAEASAQEQIIAAYYNETSEQWEPMPFAIAEDRNQVIIPTDHLTHFGLFRMGSGLSQPRNTTAQGSLSLVPASDYDRFTMQSFSQYFNDKKRGIQTAVSQQIDRAGNAVNTLVDGARSAGRNLSDSVSSGISRVSSRISQTLDHIDNVIIGGIADKISSDFFISTLDSCYGFDKIISVYKTANFNIYFLMEEHEKMATQGYSYLAGQEAAISYNNNYEEIKLSHEHYYQGTQRSLLKKYETKQSSFSNIPSRFVTLGSVLEEAYQSYAKFMGALEPPINIFVGVGASNPADASAYYSNLKNHLFMPYVWLNDEEGMRKTAAHELFHAFQRNYFYAADMKINKWASEITAEYAAYKVAYSSTLNMQRLNFNYFNYPLGTVETIVGSVINLFVDGYVAQEHEYRTATFLHYLAENHGFKLDGFFNYYKQNPSSTGVSWLESYMKTLDSSFSLSKSYLDFSAKMMLDSGGDLSAVNIYDNLPSKPVLETGNHKHTFNFSNTMYKPQVQAIQIKAGTQPKKFNITFDSKNDQDTYIKVYHLEGNTKVANIQPVGVNSLGKEVEVQVNAKDGDVIYVLSAPIEGKWFAGSSQVIIEEQIDFALKVNRLVDETNYATVELTVTGSKIDEDKTQFRYNWSIVSENANHVPIPQDQSIDNKLTVTLPFEGNQEDWDQGHGSPFSVTTIGTSYAIQVDIYEKSNNQRAGRVISSIVVGGPKIRVEDMMPGIH